MQTEEAIYSIALTLLPRVGAISAKRILSMAGSATFAFKELSQLVSQDIIPPIIADEMCKDTLLISAEELLDKTLNLGIEVIPYASDKYPLRLKECNDNPVLLYYKGDVNLNARRILSIVGTRNITSYGKEQCNRLIEGLSSFDSDILIVSGLAYGVDVESHKQSLNRGMNTVGVLAHGLDILYPAAHRSVANQMVHQGGLLTEFPISTQPLKQNFISRNRIIAGLSDATIVIESALKGGSLITADIANSYNRDCFALPGRCSDTYSEGCNQIIKENKAQLFESFEDIIHALGWSSSSEKQKVTKPIHRDISSLNLNSRERNVIEMLQLRGDLQIDNLVVLCNIPIQTMHTTLFELEMKGVLKALAGGTYHLL